MVGATRRVKNDMPLLASSADMIEPPTVIDARSNKPGNNGFSSVPTW